MDVKSFLLTLKQRDSTSACILIKLMGSSLAVTGGKTDVHRVDCRDGRMPWQCQDAEGKPGEKVRDLQELGGAKLRITLW